MLGKRIKTDFSSSSNFDTLIGKNTSLEGLLEADGTVRVDGKIKGDMKVKGDIFIGESSHIQGNIICTNIIVGGRVEGNITAHEQLRITATGRVIGDIAVKSLIIDENGQFEGNSKMELAENKTSSRADKDKKKEG